MDDLADAIGDAIDSAYEDAMTPRDDEMILDFFLRDERTLDWLIARLKAELPVRLEPDERWASGAEEEMYRRLACRILVGA